MEITLDGIISKVEDKYGVELTDISRRISREFLERQNAQYTKYRFIGEDIQSNPAPNILFAALVDRLMVFLYLVGEIPITAGRKNATEVNQIKTIDDLWMLSPVEIGIGNLKNRSVAPTNKTDSRLYNLYSRILYKAKNNGFPNWPDGINQIGKDRYVKKHFRREISFEDVKASANFTVEDVLKTAQETYGLSITAENTPIYLQFLQRQLKKLRYNLNHRATSNPKNPYPYFNAMVDRLLLFVYLIGEKDFMPEDGKPMKVKSIEDVAILYAARAKDYDLNRLYTRINARAKRYRLPKFHKQWDDVISDEYVAALYGTGIKYKELKVRKKVNVAV